MSRPVPTLIMHFTHLDNLPGVVANGLVSDTIAGAEGATRIDVGEQSIKAARRKRSVPLPPGGVVADYAPFYFAPRSPMMFSIDRGNVATYQHGCDRLVYLVTSLERLAAADLPFLVTDRNAVLAYATYRSQDDATHDHVDWDLMRSTWWHNTPEFPDRKERRMAECLVPDRVPWTSFDLVVAKADTVANRARTVLAAAAQSTAVTVRGGWYF